MARYHVNTNNGNSGVCRATTKDGCPFGGESGSENHYDTPEEARDAAEKHMSNLYGEVYKGYRRGETDGLGLHKDMKRRLILESAEGKIGLTPAIIGRVFSEDKDELVRKAVAENLNSQKLLRDMSRDESARVRKLVAKKSNNREVLSRLAADPDPKVRYAAIHNESTPAKPRKAAQAAIREANLKNLAKARASS